MAMADQPVTVAGLHGLGRFGQHLLHAWLCSPDQALSIEYLADEALNVDEVCALLQGHDRLDFSAAAPAVDSDCLLLTRASGERVRLPYHHGTPAEAPWLGQPDLWLECSGRYPEASRCRIFAIGNTRQVLVSATSWDADHTLIMGFNHTEWSPQARVVSYGSCTVNAFTPLAQWLHDTYGVLGAHVSVVHNVAPHQLTRYPDPVWRPCTLEGMAPRLLPWLKPENFAVSYALVPYTGGSLIEMLWQLRKPPTQEQARASLRQACQETLQGRYSVLSADMGARGVVGTSANAVFHEAGITVQGNRLRLQGSFDNENSAVRYLELACWIAARLRPVP